MRNKILYYSIKYSGDWNKIASAIKNNEAVKKCECDYSFVTIVDDHYPNKLRGLRYPPWIIFYSGNLSLCDEASIGIVGSRIVSEYGINCTKKICDVVALKRVIVSGLARGIDEYAHRFSIEHKTIAVIGCGINVVYPKQNSDLYEIIKKKHLLLSEYPPDVEPCKHHFPWRNRIIAALSDKLVVPQSKIKSGTSITVSWALELGKEIYAIPHPISDENGAGCNDLIYNGANILINFEDLT